MNPVLEVKELFKSYQGRTAVNGLSLQVHPGEAVALLGPNGSGKTTTLRCIAGLIRPDSGSIRIEGTDLAASPCEAKSRLSYLPQEAGFAGTLTPLEVARFHCRLRGVHTAQAEMALEAAGISGTDRSRPIRTLSGGMRQRLSLAIAGLSEVSLMLLDEPTANLDPRAALRLREMALEWRKQGRSLLFSTHVLTDVEELADRVIVLVEGNPVVQESVTTLREHISRFAELRIDVGQPTDNHLEAALSAGATEARLNCHAILITAPLERRLAILEALSRISPVNHFESLPLSVERIYMGYVSKEKSL